MQAFTRVCKFENNDISFFDFVHENFDFVCYFMVVVGDRNRGWCCPEQERYIVSSYSDKNWYWYEGDKGWVRA